jgi:nucleotide-binding universal stress UspA family protein
MEAAMAFRNILLQAGSGPVAAARADYALGFAEKHDAHLTAIYCVPPIDVPAYVESMIPAAVREMQAKAAAKTAADAKAAFEAAARRAGRAARLEWRYANDDPLHRLTLDSRYADLAIVGQSNPDAPLPEGSVDLPGALALAAGRPVLAVPYAGRFPTLGERVLVAWNAGREAVRAVNDALPVLRLAKSVVVLAVNPKGGATQHGEQPGADIALHLARHGVKAEAMRAISDEIDPGDVILSRAADIGADMLVMGAFGRSRLRELVLGGVTRHILKHMTVPALLSH